MCEAKSEGLVRYPTTLAPFTGNRRVTVQCADNAYNISNYMTVRCGHDGVWSQILGGPSPRCFCSPGYRTASVKGRDICRGLFELFSCCTMYRSIKGAANTIM